MNWNELNAELFGNIPGMDAIPATVAEPKAEAKAEGEEPKAKAETFEEALWRLLREG